METCGKGLDTDYITMPLQNPRGGASLLVWGDIGMGEHRDLYVIHGQTLNAKHYLNNI